ncbi:MAG: ArnT family glycosyltransferase [Oscillospiraceae bacterium]
MKKKAEELKQFITDVSLPLWLILLMIFWFIGTMYFKAYELGKFWSDCILMFSAALAMTGIIYFITQNRKSKSASAFAEMCRNEFRWQRCIFILAICGIAIRYFYIIYTLWYERQHDVGSVEMEQGHVAYIWEMYANNFRIPDGDPRIRWQFYHPPLHHILEALFMKIISGSEFNEENLQIPTFIYSCISMKIMYDFLKEMGLKEKPLVYSFALVCFNPTFIIMSGSINNDMLSSMFIYASVLYTIKWYKSPKMKYIIIIALCVGLGMMTKLSVGLAAPAIAAVFIIKFIQQIIAKNVKPYVYQYIVFLIICCPLGLWWEIRNNIKYGMPLNYIARLDETDGAWQYLGDMSPIERFTGFSFEQLKNVFIEWNWSKTSYLEYNPLVALIKTSAFGEFNLLEFNPYIKLSSNILFWSNLLVILISFVSMLYVIFSRKSGQNTVVKIFLSLIFLVFFGNYIIFCIQYPFVCTMNIRYATVLIMIGIYFTGEFLKHLEKSNSKVAGFFRIFTICIVFTACSSSAYVYTALAAVM